MVVGYTAGVYDLFHIGHLNVIREAKKRCDYLIVAVSTDELVKEYKHKQPFICYEERKQIIEALKYVDEVVPQINRDKIAAYEKYKFDIMFVGDDWKGNELFVKTEKYLNEHGAKVEYLPYTKTTSSTKLQETINKFLEN